MSNIIKQSTFGLKVIAVSLIHYFKERNFSRTIGNFFKDENDQKYLIVKLFTEGWNEVLGIPAVTEMSKEDQDLAVKELHEEWEKLKSEKDDFNIVLPESEGKTIVSPSDRLRQFERDHVKNGKIIVPKYDGVNGFRRNSVLDIVNALRQKKGLALIEEIPVVVKSYANTLDRIADCVRENTGKTDGAKNLDYKDLVRSGYEMFVCGANEAKFRVVFKAGTGQKLFGIMQLNKQYPDLKIVEKVCNGEMSAVGWGKEELREFVTEPVDVETVKSYLEDPSGTGNSPQKMMSKTDIGNIGKNTEIDFLKDFIQNGILKNDPSVLKKMIPYIAAINAATKDLYRKAVVEKQETVAAK